MLTLSNAFLSIKKREMKSESGFSLAMASKPFQIPNYQTKLPKQPCQTNPAKTNLTSQTYQNKPTKPNLQT